MPTDKPETPKPKAAAKPKAAKPKAPPKREPIGLRILEIAKREEADGVAEEPMGSNSGRHGKPSGRILMYQAKTWLDNPATGWPWCVAFAWCHVVGEALGRAVPYPTASVAQLWAWASGDGARSGLVRAVRGANGMQLGDLAIIVRRTAGGIVTEWQHVTIVAELSGGGAYCLGGNQRDRVGTDHYSGSSIYGYVRVLERKTKATDKPPRKPLWEVVIGEGETARVIATGKRLRVAKLAAGTLAHWMKRGRRVTIRRKRR